MRERQSRTGWRARIAALAGAVVVLTLAGAASAHAYWVANASLVTTVKSADPAVQLAGHAALAVTYTSTAPGPLIAPLTLTALGDVPLQLSLTTSSTNASLTAAIRLRTWVRSGSTCGTAIPATGVATSTLAAPQLPSGATAITGPASVVVCAATDVVAGYATFSGQSTTATLTLTGQIAGTTWKGTASGTFTQALAANPGGTLTCTDTGGGNGGTATLTWNKPAGLVGTGWPAGYFVTARNGTSYVQLDNTLWADATRSVSVHPSKFTTAGGPVGTYTAQVWWSEDIRPGFAASTKTAFASADLRFRVSSDGFYYAVQCG